MNAIAASILLLIAGALGFLASYLFGARHERHGGRPHGRTFRPRPPTAPPSGPPPPPPTTPRKGGS